MLQDTHIHIQDIKNPASIATFFEQTVTDGFVRFFNCAITPSDWPLIKNYALKDSRVIPFFGFHPWFGDLADQKAFDTLAEYLAWPQAFAGEMGLDKARKNLDFELQKEVFLRQLELAARFHKPFAVHCVRAWAETINLIRANAPGLKFILHSFNGSKEIAQEIAGMGGYFSISVRQFLKEEGDFKQVFQALPLDKVLIETDFPYQVKWTSGSDYGAAVRQGYQSAANWKGVPLDEFILRVYNNGTVFTDRAADR